MSKELRRLILFSAPLFVGILNIFHPVHFEPTGIYEDIHNVVGWWIILHILNLFGFALLGLAAYLLIKEQQGKAATIAKIAIAILDPMINAFWTNNVAAMLATLGSVSWGFGMSLSAVSFTETRKPAILILGLIAGAIKGWGYSSSMLGTLPWWIAVIIIGAICFLTARPGLPAAMLILSGVLFGTTHVVPYGPLGMACFVIAASLFEFAPRKAEMPQVTSITTS